MNTSPPPTMAIHPSMLLSSTRGSVGGFAASSFVMSFMADEAASLLERLDLHSAAQGTWLEFWPNGTSSSKSSKNTSCDSSYLTHCHLHTHTHTTCECIEMFLPLFWWAVWDWAGLCYDHYHVHHSVRLYQNSWEFECCLAIVSPNWLLFVDCMRLTLA